MNIYSVLGEHSPLTNEHLKADTIPNAKRELVIMVGVQRSGKTTKVNEYIQKGYVPVSGDDVRRAFGVQYSENLEPMIHSITKIMAASLLIRGLKVIIDEVNVLRKFRNEWVKLAKKYEAKISFQIIPTPSREVLMDRAGQTYFPFAVIERTLNKYEPVTEEEIESALL